MGDSGIIFNNRLLDITFIAWFIAQLYKVLTMIIIEKKFKLKRFLETGGMPSSHSSTVSCLATCIGITQGVNSQVFAVAIVFAIVTMYDAAGIRRAAGNQARVVNIIVDEIAKKIDRKINDKKLKELLGHTPIEVLVGTVVGIGVAYIFRGYLIG